MHMGASQCLGHQAGELTGSHAVHNDCTCMFLLKRSGQWPRSAGGSVEAAAIIAPDHLQHPNTWQQQA